MAIEEIPVGSSVNDGTGIPQREAWQIVNANFAELDSGGAGGGAPIQGAYYVHRTRGDDVEIFDIDDDTDDARGLALESSISDYEPGDIIRIRGVFQTVLNITRGDLLLEGDPGNTRIYADTDGPNGAMIYVSDDDEPMQRIDLKGIEFAFEGANNDIGTIYCAFVDASSDGGVFNIENCSVSGTGERAFFFDAPGLTSHTLRARDCTFISTAGTGAQYAAFYIQDGNIIDLQRCKAVTDNVGFDLSNGAGTSVDLEVVASGTSVRGFRFDGGTHTLRNCKATVTSAGGTSSALIIPTSATVRLDNCAMIISGSGTLYSLNNSAGTLTVANTAYDVTKTTGAFTDLTQNASNLLAGTVAPTLLGSGASITTKFLRGDSTWQTLAGGGDALVASDLSQFAPSTTAVIGVGSINLGHASDTTLTRSAAGVVAVEGVNLVTTSGAQTISNKTINNCASIEADQFLNGSGIGYFIGSTGNITEGSGGSIEFYVVDQGTLGGAITSAGFVGAGAGLTALNGTNIASGTVAPARLGSGSSITTKFLRGDSTWQTVSGTGDMLAANNLSDVASASTSRNNLGASSGIWPGSLGGTGVANTSKTLTLGGSWTHTGAHTLGLTTSANTALTLPTTGTLATLAGTETLTNKTLSNAGVISATQFDSPGGAGVFIGSGVNITLGASETIDFYVTDQATLGGSKWDKHSQRHRCTRPTRFWREHHDQVPAGRFYLADYFRRRRCPYVRRPFSIRDFNQYSNRSGNDPTGTRIRHNP
jgi:hypothetical protein